MCRWILKIEVLPFISVDQLNDDILKSFNTYLWSKHLAKNCRYFPFIFKLLKDVLQIQLVAKKLSNKGFFIYWRGNLLIVTIFLDFPLYFLLRIVWGLWIQDKWQNSLGMQPVSQNWHWNFSLFIEKCSF